MKFDAEEWKNAQTAAYMKNRGKFTVNGFRKGKAPKNVIENVYGKGVFYEDALNTLFGDNYGSILDKCEKKFTVVGDPDVSVDKLEEDGVTMIATVPVRPEVKISSYKGMKIEEFAYTVSDEELNAEINEIKSEIAKFQFTEALYLSEAYETIVSFYIELQNIRGN
jgi:trigger factor